jgi:hypothetical protein
MHLSKLFGIIMKTYLKLSLLAFVVSLFAACGSTPGNNTAGGAITIIDLPVAKKGCAIGGSVLRSSISNAQDFATTTARANLASTLKETIQQMVKRYVEEGQTGGKDLAEELNTRVIRGLTEMDVIGGVVIKSYKMGNEIQVIVCIEPDAFINAFDKMNQLSQKARQALKNRAKVEFNDMDNQLDKLRGRQ